MNTFSSDLRRVVLKIYKDLGTSVALQCSKMLWEDDWEGLANISVDPRSYTDPLIYARDAAAAGLLKKYEGLPVDIDRVAAAKNKWWQGENQCYWTNERLTRYLPEFSFCSDRDPAIESFIALYRKNVRRIIGDRPPELVDGHFGPGATFSDRGDRCTVPHKIQSDPTLTLGALYHLPQFFATKWGRSLAARQGQLSVVSGNRYATAKKTALTDRSIGTEPSLNMYYQKAYGKAIRRRLRRIGLDLDRAQDIHRQLAMEASVHRRSCTVDLTNASDTNSRVFVKLGLPEGWFSVLDDLRSKKTLIDGQWVLLEKFSSMGNGFTFELETLLYYALVTTVMEIQKIPVECGVNVSVFGDDIICPECVLPLLMKTLRFFGLETNVHKTFFSDTVPFRESCGGDYFGGNPVRPFYLKKDPYEENNFTRLIAFANGIKRLYEDLYIDSRSGWFAILDCMPTDIRRIRGPKALGDIVVHDDDSQRWRIKKRRSIRYIQCYKPSKWRVISYERFDADVVLACALYGCGNRKGGVIPRDGTISYKKGWVAWS